MDEIKRATKELSKKEKARVKKYDKLVESLTMDGYKKKELTISLKKANTEGLLFPLPFAIVFALLYFFVFKHSFEGYNTIAFILVFIIGTVVHEIIHGVTWAIFAKNHFKDIEFGFIAKEITPYCCCQSSLKKYQYIIGSIMPFFLLGIVVSTISLFMDKGFTVFIFGILMIFGTGGDLSIIWLLLTNKTNQKSVLYIDHPVDCGVVMFEK